MRDSAEISGTSMNRSTVERWKSVARSGVWTSVMVVFGGRTIGRLESLPLITTRCEVEVFMSESLSCRWHTEASSGGDGVGDRPGGIAGLPSDDVERRNGEVAARRHLPHEQEIVARPSLAGKGPARRRIDQAPAGL